METPGPNHVVRAVEDPTAPPLKLSALRQVGPGVWWLVLCLAVLNTLAAIDRNIVVMLLRPIQTSLDLTATQATVAIGAAFAVANLIAGLPAGWMADRLDRRAVIGGAVALWSIFALFTGTATNFLMLAGFRGGVGLTEGVLPPAGYSLMRDRVPPSHQARAFSIFSMAPLVGTGLAFLIGGALISFVGRWDYSSVPVLAGLPAWGVVIALFGALGLPLALLSMTFGSDARPREILASGPRTQPVWPEIKANRAVYGWLGLFGASHAMLTGSLNFWVPAMLNAKFQLTPLQIGGVLGPLMLVAGPLGLYIAGLCMDQLQRKGRPGPATVAVFVAAGLFICAIVHPLAPSPTMFWMFQGLLLLFATTYLVVTSAVIAQVASPSAMGRTLALFLVSYGVLGGGVAPIGTALALDHVFVGWPDPIPAAMSVAHGLYGLVAFGASFGLYGALKGRRPADA